MTTKIINGIECMPCPIDGKNLNDCWDELFENFTDNVIGEYPYHKGTGHFAFMMNSIDRSIFNFTHEPDSNSITFSYFGLTTTCDDIRRLKYEMQCICEMGTDEYRGMFVEICETNKGSIACESKQGDLDSITFSFYHYSK